MEIYQPGIYHIYNRGNNRQRIFFTDDNYSYFLSKCEKYLKPVSEILAWCLMPNHFHFLIEVTEKSLELKKSGHITMPSITNGFRLLQSSYAKGINKQEDRTGNLFQQKTRAKLVSNDDYLRVAFFYIHQNPQKANLVEKVEDWAYSSFPDYLGIRSGTLCNQKRTIELLGLSDFDLQTEVLKNIEDEKIKALL